MHVYAYICMNICILCVCMHICTHTYLIHTNLCACVIICVLSNVQYFYADVLICLTYLQTNSNGLSIIFYL